MASQHRPPAVGHDGRPHRRPSVAVASLDGPTARGASAALAGPAGTEVVPAAPAAGGAR